MSKILYLIVEGCQTEVQLCENIFKPYFNKKDIIFDYLVVKTSQRGCEKAFRGGSISIDILKINLDLVNNPSYLVSTFVDYYGFINPEKKKIDELTEDLRRAINNENFIPYIQQYEAETFLFCKPEITTKYLGIYSNSSERKQQLDKLNKTLQEKDFKPERINDGKNSAPSKRIAEIFKQYDKSSLDFSNIINEIGIEEVRKQCPRFNSWLNEIETKIKE